MHCAMAADPQPPAAGETTFDPVLGGRLELQQPVRGHRVGHDTLLLAAFAPAAEEAVDLGAGVGGAGLAFLVRHPQARATLVEIDPALAALAAANAVRNGLSGRCRVVAADVATLGRRAGPAEPAPGVAGLVLTNPPFNLAGAHQPSPHGARSRAHMAGPELLEAWVKAASRCLAPHGLLCMILRPQDLGALLAAFAGRFGAAELLPVHPRAGADAVRLLVRAVKGRRTAPVIRPGLILAAADGTPTPLAEAVLRGAGALDPRD